MKSMFAYARPYLLGFLFGNAMRRISPVLPKHLSVKVDDRTFVLDLYGGHSCEIGAEGKAIEAQVRVNAFFRNDERGTATLDFSVRSEQAGQTSWIRIALQKNHRGHYAAKNASRWDGRSGKKTKSQEVAILPSVVV